MDKAQLLESIRSRTGRSGVLTADRYFRSIEGCFDGGFCPTKLFTSASPDQWTQALKDAESRLTFTHDALKVNRKSMKSGSEVRKGLLLEFSCVVTTPKRDRVRDILDTKGARLDASAPLLWQHISLQPLGPQLAQKKTDKALYGTFGIVDTELGWDAAKLIEAGALRISHGFEPDEDGWEAMEDGGFKFKAFEIFEVSAVSVPCNTDAIITEYSRGTLKNEGVRLWAKKMFDDRKVQIPGVTLEKPCACETKEVPAVEKSYGDISGSYEELRDQLCRDAKRYLAAHSIALGCDDWCYVVATFADHCIVCVYGPGSEKHYRIAWQMQDSKASLTGDPAEVELKLTVEQKQRIIEVRDRREVAPHDRPQFTPGIIKSHFTEAIRPLSRDDQSEITESLLGLIGVAKSQREDLAWQRALDSLGLE